MSVINILSILCRNEYTHLYVYTNTHAYILTSPLQLELIGWMSAYGAVCIVVIVILMTDSNNGIETWEMDLMCADNPTVHTLHTSIGHS